MSGSDVCKLQEDWFRGKQVLDIGCNIGEKISIDKI
jgi:2-polyprenyl-3-methyl-5-hydroxy-6-metoxy-1,4-benzoquinol methylase